MDEALRAAVLAGSVQDIVASVQGGAGVNARDEDGETALTLATGIELGPKRAEACVRCLLRLGARVSEEQPQGGLGTSVHLAAAHGYTGALKELLSADGKVSLNAFDDLSRTPLICAVQKGHIAEASMLLEASADVDAHDDRRIGNTALNEAVQSGNEAMVRLLLKYGADPTVPGWMQLSALDRARDWAAADSAPELLQIYELLEQKAGSSRKKRS